MCGAIGIGAQMSLLSGDPNWGTFRYFTNLSNLACVLYFLVAALWLIFKKDNKNTTLYPTLKYIVMMSITVTMLVAQFMLSGFTMDGTMGFALILLHRVVPIMVILDWLLFDKKGLITKFAPILGVIAPLIYFAYAVIAAQFETVLQNDSRYPYPFIDIDKLGVSTVSTTVIMLLIGFIALGYIFYAVDYGLAKYSRKRARSVVQHP